LPLTTTQDYALFTVLGHRTIELWQKQIRLITEKNGLVSFNVHPDYMISEKSRNVYRELLAYLRQVCAEQRIWIALPGEVDQWWRQRRQMRLIKEGGRLRITGPMSERAVIAYAGLKDGQVVYEVPDRAREMTRTSA